MISPCKDSQFTLFTTFKPFAGESAFLQDAALKTWVDLNLPIIVFGDEQGVAQRQVRFGFHHEASVRTSDTGTPFISDMIERAAEIADTPYIALINGDILLDHACVATLDGAIGKLLDRPGDGGYLLSARRKNIPLTAQDLKGRNCLAVIEDLENRYGHWDIDNAIDIFVFDKSLYDKIPDLSVGRSGWDNWLLWEARRRGGQLVDLSFDMALKHPIHGYVGPQGGWANLMTNSDVVKNQSIVAADKLTFSHMDLYLVNGEITNTIPDSEQPVARRFSPDPDKELIAGLRYLQLSSAREDERFDACRSLLWRLEAYFPFSLAAEASANAWQNVFDKAEAGDNAIALSALQAILCATLHAEIDTVTDAGGRVYIWGTGDLGARAFRYLRPHHPETDFALISQEGTISGNFGTSLAVYEPGLASSQDQDLIIIASIYIRDILATAKELCCRGRIVY